MRCSALNKCRWLGLLCALWFGPATAAGHDYRLTERLVRLAEGVWAVRGDHAHFSAANGGNILNTGFIATAAGAVVIDTGPSLAYGEQLRTLVEATTSGPVALVLNTHHHPDHWFGNGAFADVPIRASAATIADMRSHADGYADALYRAIGRAMYGTEYRLPDAPIAAGPLDLGGGAIELLELSGHTRSELVVIDRARAIGFAGDLVFYRRAATTPHAEPGRWLASLETLAELPIDTWVPGHGPVDRGGEAIAQTGAYLRWLDRHLRALAAAGATAAEALHAPLPAPFDALAVMPAEYQRSVHHLFPALEAATFYPPLELERR